MARLYLESPGAFFPPLREGDETPEFLRWAIEYRCPPREQYLGDDLEGLFRQLRPLAAVGETHGSENLDSEQAITSTDQDQYEFDAAEVLAFYSVAGLKDVPCWNCPANGEAARFPKCIGIFSRSEGSDEFVVALERELVATKPHIPRTTPKWYGIWADSPLRGERLQLTANIIESATHQLTAEFRPATDLLLGLKTAGKLNASLHTQLLPSGLIRDGRWELPAHCGYCGGVRAARQRICKICKHDDRWKSPEKRHPMGIRPYRPAKRRG